MSLKEAIAKVNESLDHRVFSKVPHFPDPRPNLAQFGNVFVLLDCETTGLDPNKDKMIELAMARVVVANGRLIGVESVLTRTEDPGFPLPELIKKKTGLSDDEIKGTKFDDKAFSDFAQGAKLIIAHNAAFDRPFVERRLKAFIGTRWACTMREVPWDEDHRDGLSLRSLLADRCLFSDNAHSALGDIEALYALLDQRFVDGRRVMPMLVESSSRPTKKISAHGWPFDRKDDVKARGYRWEADAKVWSIEVSPEKEDDELVFLSTSLACRPKITKIDATKRYSISK